LPHWQEPGSVYFITWRCIKGIILSSQERTITLEAIRYWEGRKWKVYAAVVMPEHVHVLARPLQLAEGRVVDLSEILHSIKSFTSHKIQKRRKEQGSIWQDERYDRIVRDEMEFAGKWEYIRHNPVKKELVQKSEDYPWLYEST
jgi:REP element-mobilizing transposase RayT